MKPLNKTWLAIGIAIILIFLGREFFLVRGRELQIVCEENIALIHTREGRIIGFRNTDSSLAESITRSLSPYFLQTSILALNSFAMDTEYEGRALQGKDFVIQLFSPHIIRGVFDDQVIWFLGDFSESELIQLKSQQISFSGDLWILEKNAFPDFLPPPEEGILHLGSRAPSKKLVHFAQEKSTPLVSVSKTGGFRMIFDEGVWHLKTRN